MTSIDDQIERALRPENRTWMHCGRCDRATRHQHIDWEYADGDAPEDYGEPWNDRGQAIWQCTRCSAATYGPYPWTV